MTRSWPPALALFLALAVMSAPGYATEPPPVATPPDASPRAQALQGLELLMRALEGLVRQMPVYGPPEILPNGDIVIRRLAPRPPPAPPPQGKTL